MKDVLKATYELYENKLQDLFNQVSDAKKMLNALAKDMGNNEIPYPDVSTESLTGKVKIKPDQFYNRPLATAVREFLEFKNEATHWNEIVKALRDGGFTLGKTKQAEDEARLTILRNTANFVLIGDNYFGLKEKYPDSKKTKNADRKDDPNESPLKKLIRETTEEKEENK
ncbi:MAG: hypothetical protein NTX44_05785 [Ignavibacteriales bacterium]|nr:hypothetical protein [Ignavibacteriales bacterium]